MITVFQVLQEMSVSFNEKDLKNLGNIVSTNFKNKWKAFCVPGPVPDTGFVVEKQPGGEFMTNGYPDKYKETMIVQIGQYFTNKTRKRQRIPGKAKKVGSSKRP